MPIISLNSELKALREELAYVNSQIKIDIRVLRLGAQKRKKILERIRVLEERLAEKSKKSERSGEK